MLYEKLVKPYLFRKDPEAAHHFTIKMMKTAGATSIGRSLLYHLWGEKSDPALSQTLWEVNFPNPVGLAAGLDKNGEAIPGFSMIGFGFIEIGTLTPKPQPGNEQPRLFRLLNDEALINRMGFNNRGITDTAKGLSQSIHRPVPVGINIGKNKDTPNEKAVDDYRSCIRSLYPYGDYFVINISSPNTPGLRELQYGEELKRLMQGIFEEVQIETKKNQGIQKPFLVKIAPDVSPSELQEMIHIIKDTDISGIVATNTTLQRPRLSGPHQKEKGGLSGRPLTKKSSQMIREIYQMTDGKIPIIGVGGIFNGKDAYEKICAGASLIQVYTGLIYQGPELMRQINHELLEHLHREGHKSLMSAIGSDHT